MRRGDLTFYAGGNFLKPILGTNVFYSNVHFFLNVITCKYIFYTLGYLSFTLSWTICLCGVKMDRVCCSKDISIVFSSYARDSIFNYFWKFVTFPSLYCILSVGDWDCDLHYEDKLAELMEAWV